VGSRGDLLTLGIEIAPPFWQQTWFAPTLAASIVALFASLLFVSWKRRNARRLEMLRYQNALEMDRTRIARDLHDDLGSRVTHLALTADLARRAVPHDPDKARRHLDKMSAAARNLVAAMDDMVWAVDPAHDTLDHLASHLMRQTEEMLQDSPVRYRFDIPAVLPPRPLATDHRHHLALAVKEAIHNVLQHAGPCDAVISLSYESDLLQIQVSDNGKGFVSSSPGPGRGMSNIPARIEAIGGTCEIHSSPGQGTSIRINCRLPEKPLFPDS
jgi:signal transduction histidine kinase